MSAFFVGPEHVNAMLSYLNERVNCGSVPTPFGDWSFDAQNVEDLQTIGRNLLAENIASLKALYPNFPEMSNFDFDGYRFAFAPDFPALRSNPAMDLLGIIACYEYQSCEHDGWQTSYAKKFCEWLRDRAIHDLPGWDKVPWHWPPARKAA